MHLVYILQHDSESSSLIIGLLSHRSSQDFCWVRGAPDRRHPALHQSCTRLKLSQAAGDMWAVQQSAESWVEPQSEKKIAKKGEMTFGCFFCKFCQPQIHKCMWKVLSPSTVFTVYLYVLHFCPWNKIWSCNLIFCIVCSQCARLLMNNGALITFDILYTFRNNDLQTLFCSALAA